MGLMMSVAATAQVAPVSPLPACTGPQGFYLAKFTGGAAASYSSIHHVELAPSLTDAMLLTGSATGTPGTVAMGMGADGALYALSSDETNTNNNKILRYDAAGKTQVAVVTGVSLPASNFNAADIDLSTSTATYPGDLIAGFFRVDYDRTGAWRNKLLRINTLTGAAQTIALTGASIPGLVSGDFVVSKDGKTVYGISYDTQNQTMTVAGQTRTLAVPVSIPWQIALSGNSGVVTLGTAGTYGAMGTARVYVNGVEQSGAGLPLRLPVGVPYGGAAMLPNDNLAFYFNGITPTEIYRSVVGPATTTIVVDAMDPHTMVVSPGTYMTPASASPKTITAMTPRSDSADGASCPLPRITLSCAPPTLVDAASKVSTCTITSDTAAPTGGLSVALTLPASNPTRYTTTCASPILIKAGEKAAQCTITAVENTVPGDGSATATLALATPAAGAPYTLGTPTSATVTVNNDDDYVANLTCTPTTLVDAPNNVSTCTLTLNGAAPSGGLTVGITPPGASTRYTTTCGTSLTVPQGQTSTTCTITATPNTTPGDGNVNAVVTIKPADGYQVGPNASATVAVNNDDGEVPVTAIPTLSQWALALLSLGLMGGAWRQRRC